MTWREDRHQILAPWSILLFTGIFAVAFWIKAFITPAIGIFPAEKSILFYYLTEHIEYNSLASKGIAFLLVVLIAVVTFFANNKYFFIKKKSALLILFMVLLMGLSDPSHNLNPGIIGLVFLLIAFIRFLSMQGKQYSGSQAFDIGLYIAIGSMFYTRMLFFMPIFYIGFYMYQQLHLKNILATFFGTSFPYILVGTISFLIGDFNNFLYRLHFSLPETPYVKIGHLIYFGLLGLVALLAFMQFIGNFNNEKIKTRNTIGFIYLLLAASIASALFSPHIFLFEIPFISFFLSMLFAHFFATNTSKFARILFYVFWIVAIIWFLMSFIL
ncbi:MAG: hypothetical protein KA397_03830 [Paludibacteraceae bacterium]|nr:hypothetical protein [Paludibacteraceae bacterium]MBP6284274.1 hypothetical protein [Paludibacteraceae bacterium]